MGALAVIDLIDYFAATILTVVCGLSCFRRAQKGKAHSFFYYMLTGFYGCICMSDLFYLLTWVVEDYPFVFSPGDISWVGGIVFLITAALSLVDTWTPEQKQSAKKYRLFALTAPLVWAAFNAVYIYIYPEIALNYLLYGVPSAILAFLSLWLFLAGRNGGVQPEMRFYHLAALLWIGIQLFYDLFNTLGWDYGYAVPSLICGWAMVVFSVNLYFRALKGAQS